MTVFEKSSVHSDFLKYAHSNGAYNGVQEDIIVDSFINSYDSFKYYSSDEILQIKTVISARRLPNTKSDENGIIENVDIRRLSEDVLSQLSDLDDYTQITQKAISLLQKEEYITLSSEEYAVLCVTAATFADSYQYWADNIADIIGEPQTKSSAFWGYVKKYAIADAEEALASACVSAIFGPLCLEAIFVSAGVGSMIVCGKDIIAMI